MDRLEEDGLECPFCGILNGSEPGKVIARDDDKGFALIQSIHPEAIIHWMAVPVEHVHSTEMFQHEEPARFLDLVDFAMTQAKCAIADYPQLQSGFSLKIHVGAFETVPHAKLHILSVE